jgi:transmembrane sensor
VKQTSDELSAALEALRNRPIVTESRDYARSWANGRTRAGSARRWLSAAAAVACVAAYLFSGLPIPGTAVHSAAQKLFATGIGETRPIVLEDGSRILLDTRSRLRVAFTADARDIELLEGQAHFEVATDLRRPFRVRSGSAEVVAVGTRFDVAALPTRTTVTLIEGRVNVRTLPGAAHSEPQVAAMTPGQQLGITSDGQLVDELVVKIENVTAWQRGTLVLDDVPLPDALAAMNRYSVTQIVIPSPTLQSRRVSGVFHVGDVETEALALQRFFGLRETVHSDRAIVLEHN